MVAGREGSETVKLYLNEQLFTVIGYLIVPHHAQPTRLDLRLSNTHAIPRLIGNLHTVYNHIQYSLQMVPRVLACGYQMKMNALGLPVSTSPLRQNIFSAAHEPNGPVGKRYSRARTRIFGTVTFGVKL